MTKEKSTHKEKVYVIGAGIDTTLLAEKLHKEGYRAENYDIIIVDSKDEIPGADKLDFKKQVLEIFPFKMIKMDDFFFVMVLFLILIQQKKRKKV